MNVLRTDVCEFNVPEFICEQRLRIRTKIHTKQNKNGFCKLSVTVACQPKNIEKLEKSNFSLDNIAKLPKKLMYIETNTIIMEPNPNHTLEFFWKTF